MKLLFKNHKAKIKALDKTKGIVTIVFATLGVEDKDGDVIEPGAFGDKQVAMILPAHNWSHIPLGKARIFETGSEAIAELKFNLDIEVAKDWFKAIVFDLEGTSVQEYSFGFTIKDRSEGTHNERPVRFLKELEVHEISPVVRGAGVNTRTIAAKSGIDLEDLSGEVEDKTVDEDGAKVATPRHKTPVVDETWTARVHVARVRSPERRAYFGRMYAYRDPEEDATLKVAYSFPHHKVSANGTPGAAVIKALISGIAALNGARGGADVSDREGVHRHLAGHLRDAGESVPALKSLDDSDESVLNPSGKSDITLSDQAETALASSQELVRRVKSLADLRAKDGRSISKDTKAQVLELLKEFEKVRESLSALTKNTDKKKDEDSSEAAKAFAEYQRTEAKIGGHL